MQAKIRPHQTFIDNGYELIALAIRHTSKAPLWPDWSNKLVRYSTAVKDSIFNPKHLDDKGFGVGLRCGMDIGDGTAIFAFDVDVLDEALVRKIVARIGSYLPQGFITRVGMPPKTMILVRTSLEKLKVPSIPIGPGQQIEGSGLGKQVVVYGPYPDPLDPTRVYTTTPDILGVKATDIPFVSQDDIKKIWMVLDDEFNILPRSTTTAPTVSGQAKVGSPLTLTAGTYVFGSNFSLERALEELALGVSMHDNLRAIIMHWANEGWLEDEIRAEAEKLAVDIPRGHDVARLGIGVPGGELDRMIVDAFKKVSPFSAGRVMREAMGSDPRKDFELGEEALEDPFSPIDPDVPDTEAVVSRLVANAAKNTSVTSEIPIELEFTSVGKELVRVGGVKFIPPRKWLVSGLVEVDTLAVIGGPGGSGKSSVLNGLLASLATGNSLVHGDWAVRGNVGVPTLVCNDDDTGDELLRRFGGLSAAYGLMTGDLDEVWFVGADRLPDVKFAETDKSGKLFINEKWLLALSGAIAKLGAKCVILDPLNGLADVNENDNGGMGAISRRLNRFAKENGVAVILVHHANKMGGNADTKGERSADIISGGKRLQDKARSSWVIDILTKSDFKALGLDEDDPRVGSIVGMWQGKVNNQKGIRGRPRWMWEMDSVCLGNGLGLDLDDWVQVPRAWAVPVVGGSDAVVLAALGLIADGGVSGAYSLARNVRRDERKLVLAVRDMVDWEAEGYAAGDVPGEGSVTEMLGRHVIRAGLAEEKLVSVRVVRSDMTGKSKTETREGMGLVLTKRGEEELERLLQSETERPF